MPLAMPLMFGPGAIATILGMTSLMRKSDFGERPYPYEPGAEIAKRRVV